MMKPIALRFPDGRKCPIHVGAPLRGLGRALRAMKAGPRVMVVTVKPVRRYAAPLLRGLRAAGFQPRLVLMPDGESRKTLATATRLYGECLKSGLDRKSTLIALGGGVVGDVVGFVAATYMRGIRVVQCPTTLLSMVDAAIGGKTGVDLPQGKNLVGAFHQPALVWMDLAVLKTLPPRQWRTGLAEIIKYGVIKDPAILTALERTRPGVHPPTHSFWKTLVAQSARIKAGVVMKDERETRGLREILNFGHTFAHAIEAVTRYKTYTHGEAVAIGMHAASRLVVHLGKFTPEAAERLRRLIKRWGLPVRVKKPLPRAKVLKALSRDKKVMSGQYRFVLPTRLGHVHVVKSPARSALQHAFRSIGL